MPLMRPRKSQVTPFATAILASFSPGWIVWLLTKGSSEFRRGEKIKVSLATAINSLALSASAGDRRPADNASFRIFRPASRLPRSIWALPSAIGAADVGPAGVSSAGSFAGAADLMSVVAGLVSDAGDL